MIILFTGHRDKKAQIESLELIANLYPDSTWMHGGASGFDAQVESFAQANQIPTLVFRPVYDSGINPRSAPIIRNKEMVAQADLVVACFDGRKEGGTRFTMEHARKVGKKVITIQAV